MATHLAIDPDLLDRAVLVSGERTKKAAVTLALREFIARRDQRRVVDLPGTLEWDHSFEHKAERSRRGVTLLVDTSVWSLAFRRAAEATEPGVHHLKEALPGSEIVVTTGLVLPELLRGFSGRKCRLRSRF